METGTMIGRRACLRTVAAAFVSMKATADDAGSRPWTQEEVDAGFDVVKASPNYRWATARWASNSEAARASLGAPRRIPYGAAPDEALDLYPGTRPGPVLVFIHGGAFNVGRAADFAFVAEAYVRAGAHVVIPDFGRARDFGSRIEPLVDQVRAALRWVHGHAESFGGDAGRIFVAGHSSGAELASQLVAAGGSPIKGALLCSGAYDLRAFARSRQGASFHFTDDEQERLDVVAHSARVDAQLLLACGSLDTPLFRAGAARWHESLAATGNRATLLEAQGYNHFEVIETLASPYAPLGRAMFAMMQLRAG